MSVVVCMLAYGPSNYVRAGRRAIMAVLRRSAFDVFVGVDHPTRLSDLGSRVHPMCLPPLSPAGGRAQPFLLKFAALEACLRATSATHLLLMDADALLVRPLEVAHVVRALDGAPLGMVEQTGIRGSTMARPDFLDHYVRHTLAWFGARDAPPLDRFRFFNSGVVLGTREGFERFTAWACPLVAESPRPHQVGAHMIADQDYLQFWCNALHPGACRELSWRWNHCEHWDEGFPRGGANILHFSNFCNGPTRRQQWRMDVAEWRARLLPARNRHD